MDNIGTREGQQSLQGWKENSTILESLKDEILDHLDKNYNLLLDKSAIIKVDYYPVEIRRMVYRFQINTDTGLKEISYEIKLSIHGVNK